MNRAYRHIDGMKGVRCLTGRPLSRYTSMRVGGPAEILTRPDNDSALARLLAFLSEKGLDWYLLGGGTNTIFGEKGFSGVVIKLGRGFRQVRKSSPGIVTAGATAPLSLLLDRTLDWGLGGLEFCHGIPGTVGGAASGNAGMDGLGIHDRIIRVHGITGSGEAFSLSRGEYSCSYRNVEWPFYRPSRIIITRLDFQLESVNRDRQNRLLERYREIRSRQPASRGTAGSIFKNPPGDFAGRLIDAAGLKGRFMGGARVSPFHGNWILNTGEASAGDVIGLIGLIRETVKRRFGVLLEPEVKLVGVH